jgi:hypothetical protein
VLELIRKRPEVLLGPLLTPFHAALLEGFRKDTVIGDDYASDRKMNTPHGFLPTLQELSINLGYPIVVLVLYNLSGDLQGLHSSRR